MEATVLEKKEYKESLELITQILDETCRSIPLNVGQKLLSEEEKNEKLGGNCVYIANKLREKLIAEGFNAYLIASSQLTSTHYAVVVMEDDFKLLCDPTFFHKTPITINGMTETRYSDCFGRDNIQYYAKKAGEYGKIECGLINKDNTDAKPFKHVEYDLRPGAGILEEDEIPEHNSDRFKKRPQYPIGMKFFSLIEDQRSKVESLVQVGLDMSYPGIEGLHIKDLQTGETTFNRYGEINLPLFRKLKQISKTTGVPIREILDQLEKARDAYDNLDETNNVQSIWQ